MNLRKWAVYAIIILDLVVINCVILAYLNRNYPFIGHDYRLAFPVILDSALHFRLNGLSIQWFTPSFGAGIPAYPNPNNVQFSLPVLLSIILPPLQAVMATVVVYVVAGYITCIYFFRSTVGLEWTSSILGATFFSANGFIIERVTSGHLGYITFPLLPLFLIALLEKSKSIRLASAILGIGAAFLLHSAGYFILILFGFSTLITIPLLFIYSPALIDWKRFFLILAIGGAVALVISASKLSAVYSFMQSFPRTISDEYASSLLIGLKKIALQLMGTMNLVPIFLVTGHNPDRVPAHMSPPTDSQFGYWETDISISPVLFVIFLVGLIVFLVSWKKNIYKLLYGKRKIAWIILILFLWLNIEFIVAKGFIYPLLKNLPILSSLHVNARFTAALIFPLAFGATLIYNELIKDQARAKLLTSFLLANLFSLVFLGTFFIFKGDHNDRSYDVSDSQKIYQQMHSGMLPDVTRVGQTGGGTSALLSGTSNLDLYEPAFGYGLEYFHPEVTEDSVWAISNGYYNMTDPTGFIYPEMNSNRPFERFRIEDKEMLGLFVRHIQPSWRIPTYQKVLDWVSFIAFIMASIFVIFQLFRKEKKL